MTWDFVLGFAVGIACFVLYWGLTLLGRLVDFKLEDFEDDEVDRLWAREESGQGFSEPIRLYTPESGEGNPKG